MPHQAPVHQLPRHVFEGGWIGWWACRPTVTAWLDPVTFTPQSPNRKVGKIQVYQSISCDCRSNTCPNSLGGYWTQIPLAISIWDCKSIRCLLVQPEFDQLQSGRSWGKDMSATNEFGVRNSWNRLYVKLATSHNSHFLLQYIKFIPSWFFK